ncbi:MAG: hypothetical protein PUD15_06825 [Prevotella sp.]|nr:hypothetical protein [Prevotella sp.]
MNTGSIETSATGGRITDFSFYITKMARNSNELEKYDYPPSVIVSGWRNNDWEDFATIS